MKCPLEQPEVPRIFPGVYSPGFLLILYQNFQNGFFFSVAGASICLTWGMETIRSFLGHKIFFGYLLQAIDILTLVLMNEYWDQIEIYRTGSFRSDMMN